jgi:ACS family hexuronate transporter-like MFS transporter
MKSFRSIRSGEVVALLLTATTINYIDRQTLSVLAPLLQKELHISSLQYSYAVNSFLIVYSPMYLVMGRVLDRLGSRRGMGLAVVWWSVAEILHGAVVGIKTLCLFRAMLAIGEAAIIPGGVKAVAEWFSPKQRGVAIGTFETGLSLGPILAPPVVVWMALRYSWREAFVWTGIMGLAWAIPWMLFYRPPTALTPRPQPAEGLPVAPAPIKWAELFTSKGAWAVGLGRFFGDPIWYFYLFWLPKYMADSKGLSIKVIGELAWIPYVASLLGSLTGGAFSSWLVKRGSAPIKARLRALAIGTILVTFGVFSVFLNSIFWMMTVISLGAFALLFWGSNVDTLPTDLFPSKQVAQVVGFGGLMGALGGILFTASTGYAVTHYSYTPVWIASGVTYPVGLLIMYLLLREASTSSREADQYNSVTALIE